MLNEKELRKHLTEDLGCVFGIFHKGGVAMTCFNCKDDGEAETLSQVGIQLIITAIKMPKFGRMLEFVNTTLKQDRKDLERLVDELDPMVEINARVKNGNQD